MRRILSGTLLVAGTTIGAGMLGIPLLTAKCGFFPAFVVTLIVWAFMLTTGLLLVELFCKLPEGSHLSTLSQKYLGKRGDLFVSLLFLFLYYCLIVAYLSAGAPLLFSFFKGSGTNFFQVFSFTLLFGLIVLWGTKKIDLVNRWLTVGLFGSFAVLITLYYSSVSSEKLRNFSWETSLVSIPVLFSAFGYHNLVPSLCTYMKRDKRVLRWSFILGTGIAFVIYVAWQFIVLGAVPQEMLFEASKKGTTAAAALFQVAPHPWTAFTADLFAFFAIVTSLLGVRPTPCNLLHS